MFKIKVSNDHLHILVAVISTIVCITVGLINGTEKKGRGSDRINITPVSCGALTTMRTASRTTTVVIRGFHDDLVAASRETTKGVPLPPPSQQQQQQLNLTEQRFIIDKISVYGWLATSRLHSTLLPQSSSRRRLY